LECGGLFTLSFEGPSLLGLKMSCCVKIWVEALSVAKAGASYRTPKDAVARLIGGNGTAEGGGWPPLLRDNKELTLFNNV
jgi:hypothetical protein